MRFLRADEDETTRRRRRRGSRLICAVRILCCCGRRGRRHRLASEMDCPEEAPRSLEQSRGYVKCSKI